MPEYFGFDDAGDGFDQSPFSSSLPMLSARTGAPTVTFAAEAAEVINRDAAMSARSGSPTVTFVAEAEEVVNRDAAMSARSGTPSVTVSASAAIPCSIDDFNLPLGREAEVLMSVFVGDGGEQYYSQTVGSISADSDPLLDDAGFTISGIVAPGTLILQRAGAGSWVTDFRDNPYYAEALVHVQYEDGTELEALALSDVGQTQNSFISYRLSELSFYALTEGDCFLLAITVPAIVNADAALSARTGAPTVTFAAEAVEVINQDAALVARSGSPAVAIAADAVDINHDAALSVRAGSPTVRFAAATVDINADAALVARSGSPLVTFAADGLDINQDAALLVSTGSPMVSFAAEGMAPVIADAVLEVSTGAPAVAISAESLDINQDAAFSGRTGAPVVTFAAEGMAPVVADAVLEVLTGGRRLVTFAADSLDINQGRCG